MSNLTLQPKEIRQHSVGNDRFLIVRSATRYIWVVSDSGERIRVEGGDRLDIAPFKQISQTEQRYQLDLGGAHG